MSFGCVGKEKSRVTFVIMVIMDLYCYSNNNKHLVNVKWSHFFLGLGNKTG